MTFRLSSTYPTTRLNSDYPSIWKRPELIALGRTVPAYFWDLGTDGWRLRMQGNPTLKVSALAKEWIKNPVKASVTGLKTSSTGGLVYMLRRGGKEAMRYSSMGPLNKMYYGHTKDAMTAKVLTGLSLAALDNLLLPFDMSFNQKVHNTGYVEFFKRKVVTNGPVELYRALVPSLYRSASSWTVFMVANHKTLEMQKRLDPRNKHPYVGYFSQVGATLLATTASIMPFDNIRNRMQLSERFQKLGTVATAREIVKTEGVTSLARGAEFYMIRQFPHTLLGVAAVNVILNNKE